MTRLSAMWTWLKWTVQLGFIGDKEALPCGCYKGKKPPNHLPGEPCLVRPGDDDQWEEWIEERDRHE